MKIFMTVAGLFGTTQDLADGFGHPMQPWPVETAIEAVKDHSQSLSTFDTFSMELKARGRYVVEEPRQDLNDPAYWADKV